MVLRRRALPSCTSPSSPSGPATAPPPQRPQPRFQLADELPPRQPLRQRRVHRLAQRRQHVQLRRLRHDEGSRVSGLPSVVLVPRHPQSLAAEIRDRPLRLQRRRERQIQAVRHPRKSRVVPRSSHIAAPFFASQHARSFVLVYSVLAACCRFRRTRRQRTVAQMARGARQRLGEQAAVLPLPPPLHGRPTRIAQRREAQYGKLSLAARSDVWTRAWT